MIWLLVALVSIIPLAILAFFPELCTPRCANCMDPIQDDEIAELVFNSTEGFLWQPMICARCLHRRRLQATRRSA